MASISNVSVFFFLLITVSSVDSSDDATFKDITIIVLSQSNSYHVKKADSLRDDFNQQIKDLQLKEDDEPSLILLHDVENLPEIGLWTYFPLFSKYPTVFPITKWTLVCEEDTRIKLPKLLELLATYDSKEELFLGRALYDTSHVVIHHYYEANFPYPDVRAGFVLSEALMTRLGRKLSDLSVPELSTFDFSIDPKHEISKYMKNEMNVSLTDVKELCVLDLEDCVTFDNMRFPNCGSPISIDDLSVAVKTCEKFHTDRIPVVKKTWGSESPHIEYFSETEDPTIPTINLGVPNTERGHCGKTMAIIKRAANEEKQQNRKWLLIADDDTIISLQKLRLMLGCYDGSEPVALGERYGYLSSKGYGYDYITGGGGMVFSWPMVKKLADECVCPSNDSPDDMILGMCWKRMNIPVTHCPYIHQARMVDYSQDFLKHRSHISFHKHFDSDPLTTYKTLNEDLQTLHDEL